MCCNSKREEPVRTKLQTPTGLRRIRNLITLFTTSFTSSTTSKVVLLRPSGLGRRRPSSMEVTITEIKRLAAASPTMFFGTSWSKMFSTASSTDILCTSAPLPSVSKGANGEMVQPKRLVAITAPSTAATMVVKQYKDITPKAKSLAPGRSRIIAMDWIMPQTISGKTAQVRAFSQSFLRCADQKPQRFLEFQVPPYIPIQQKKKASLQYKL